MEFCRSFYRMPRHRLFLFCLLAFILGVGLASLVAIPLLLTGGFFILAVLFLLVGWGGRFFIGSMLLLAFAIGALRMAAFQNSSLKEASDILAHAEEALRPVRLKGEIVSFPQRRIADQTFILRATSDLRLFVRTERDPAFVYGDVLVINGRVRTAHEFLRSENVAYEIIRPRIERMYGQERRSIKRGLAYIRLRFEEIITSTLPEPLASYAEALLMGDRAGLSKSLLETFRRAGTSHIVALSGYNITIIAWFLSAFLLALGVSRRFIFWPSVAGILFFVLLTGASASVVRAGIMGFLVLIAYQTGRRYHMTNALVFAAACMILINPQILRFDVGFQLSFAATAGMIYFGRYLTDRFERVPNLWGLWDTLIATLAAQIAVLPLLLYHFGAVSLISPLVNLLILPLMPLVMAFGFAAAALGFVFLPLAKLLMAPTALLLSYQLGVMDFFARVPFASASFPRISLIACALLYAVLIAGFYFLHRPRYQKI
jgi:competence protein ComEC